MNKLSLMIILLMTLALFSPVQAQYMPSEQYVLYMVWADDSTALMQRGWGDYVNSDADTVVLAGTDIDTVIFAVPNPRGYFNIWITPDTANFTIAGVEYDHAIGTSDSLTIGYRPKLSSTGTTGNAVTELTFLDELDWTAEVDYYESVMPAMAEYLEFYIGHTGTADTSAVIIQILWQ